MIESLLAEKKWSDILTYIENPDEYLSDFEKHVLNIMAKLNLDQTVSVDDVRAILNESPITRLISRFDVYGTLAMIVQKHDKVDGLTLDDVKNILTVIFKESPSLETKLITLSYFIDSFTNNIDVICDNIDSFKINDLISQVLESNNETLVNYARKLKPILEVVCNSSTST